MLRNPHSVTAALATRPTDVLEIRVPPRASGGAWTDVVAQARAQGVSIKTELAERTPRTGDDGHRGGITSAMVRERAGQSLAEVFPPVTVQDRGLWLALDCLQDPHNVGAIFRTAAFFGVRGIAVTKDRSAPLSATVYDVASGGMEHVPFAVIANLSQALDHAKEAGLWVLGSSEHAEKGLPDVPRDRPWLLVIGNEEQGLRRLTLDRCDEICRVAPRSSGVTSLNASVAAGVMIAALT